MNSISRSFVTRNLQHNPLCSICHLGLILLVPSFQLLCALLEFPGEDKSIRLCVCVSSVSLSGALFLLHQLLPPRLNSAEMRAQEYPPLCLCFICLPAGALFLLHQLLPPRLNSAEMQAGIRDMCGHCPRAQSSMFYFPTSVDCESQRRARNQNRWREKTNVSKI